MIPTLAQEVIDLFYCNKLKPAYWDATQLAQKHARRSAEQILSDGDFHFLSLCPDLTWVSLDYFSRRGVESRLVVEKHLEERSNQPRKIHFVPEYFDTHLGKWVAIDFEMPGSIAIVRGGYTTARHFVQDALGRVSSGALDFSKSMLENVVRLTTGSQSGSVDDSIEVDSRLQIQKIIGSYDMQAHFKLIGERATQESFETWMLRYKKSPQIQLL